MRYSTDDEAMVRGDRSRRYYGESRSVTLRRVKSRLLSTLHTHTHVCVGVRQYNDIDIYK